MKKKIISLAVSLGILALIYWKLNKHGQLAELGHIFATSNSLWMTISLAMVVPLTLFTSWRLQQLMPSKGQLGFGEANRLILVASVLNLILPSKMGDIAKAYFMRDRGHMEGALALSLVVFEKACDMLSLLLWCVFGLAWVKLSGSKAMEAFRWGGASLHLAPEQQETFYYWLAMLIVAGSLALGLLLIGSPGFAQFFFRLGGRLPKIGRKFDKLGA